MIDVFLMPTHDLQFTFAMRESQFNIELFQRLKFTNRHGVGKRVQVPQTFSCSATVILAVTYSILNY
jgi:hypothetical protein